MLYILVDENMKNRLINLADYSGRTTYVGLVGYVGLKESDTVKCKKLRVGIIIISGKVKWINPPLLSKTKSEWQIVLILLSLKHSYENDVHWILPFGVD